MRLFVSFDDMGQCPCCDGQEFVCGEPGCGYSLLKCWCFTSDADVMAGKKRRHKRCPECDGTGMAPNMEYSLSPKRKS